MLRCTQCISVRPRRRERKRAREASGSRNAAWRVHRRLLLKRKKGTCPQNTRFSFVLDWQMVVHFNAMRRRPVVRCVAMHERYVSSCNTCCVVSITPPSYLIDEILQMPTNLSSTEESRRPFFKAPYETADLIVVDRGYKLRVDLSGRHNRLSRILFLQFSWIISKALNIREVILLEHVCGI